MTDILILNAQIVNEGKIDVLDVLIKDGRIEKIDKIFQVIKRSKL